MRKGCVDEYRNIHGVGFIIKVNPNIELIQIEYVNARIIVLHARVYGCLIKVINCYAPTEDSSENNKSAFYNNLKKQFSNTLSKKKIICLGDFNATTSAALFNSSLRENSIVENLCVNDNGERFHELIQKLSALNTWFNHKRCRQVKWHSPDGVTKKVYDFILSCSWLQQYATNCRVYNSYDFDSDHRLVVADLNTPGNKFSRFRKWNPKIAHKKYDFAALQTEEINHNFLTNLSNMWENAQTIDNNNTAINDRLVQSIKAAAAVTIPERVAQKLYQPWHSDQKLKELYIEKDEARSKNADSKIVQYLRKKIRKRSRYLKNQYFKDEAQKLNQLSINRELEKLFTRAKRQDTTLKSCNHSCSPDKLLKHFRTHFNPENNQPERPRELDAQLPEFVESLRRASAMTDINSQPPTTEEIRYHLQKLKNGKASNDIEPELLKRCEQPIMLNVIHRMTLNLWENLDVPSAWGNSRLKTLWKGKGSKKDPSKYRGLSIGSTVCKLIMNIILSRLKPWYEAQLTDKQNGFRTNRGTTDAIYTVKRVQQITNRKKQPLYLLFVDLTAAFDHVPRHRMFDSIRLRLCEDQSTLLIDILEKLYQNTSLTFETTFETSIGVRQGGPESPKSSYIGDIKFFQNKFRINCRAFTREQRLYMRNNDLRSWGTSILPWSGYADDLVLFLFFFIFKYLGANIDAIQPSTGDSEINHRIQLACIKFAEMSNLLQNFHINLRTRTTFFNCFIRSCLTYSCQNWSLTATQFERLDTTYRTFLRRMVRNGFKQVDRDLNDFRLVISNDALHTTSGTCDVSHFIKTQQSNYASHITRMSYERSLKQLMFNDDVYTKRGRFDHP